MIGLTSTKRSLMFKEYRKNGGTMSWNDFQTTLSKSDKKRRKENKENKENKKPNKFHYIIKHIFRKYPIVLELSKKHDIKISMGLIRKQCFFNDTLLLILKYKEKAYDTVIDAIGYNDFDLKKNEIDFILDLLNYYSGNNNEQTI